MTKLLQRCFLFFIAAVIPGHNLGNSQVSVNRTIGPALVTIYGRGGHLGHVTSNMSSDFQSLYLKAFIQNLVQIGTEVSEKIQFEFLYVHDLEPRSRNDLVLHTHISSYIQLDVCSYYLSGHWLQ